ncbi:MAG TPA: hypothetical protein PKH07_13320 [bacterium]|nr:hypothetical protein [bacterium]
MAGWAFLWKVVFVFGVSAFALLSLWVTVFGLADIKRMFEDLGRQDNQ